MNKHAFRAALAVIGATFLLNLSEGIVHGVILAAQWKAAVADLGHTLETGVVAWLCILIGNTFHCAALVALVILLRPLIARRSARAMIAAAAVWLVGWLGPALGALPMKLFPIHLWGVMMLAGLIELIVAVYVAEIVLGRRGQLTESNVREY